MDMTSLLRMSQSTFSMFVFLPLNVSCDPIIIYCTFSAYRSQAAQEYSYERMR